MLPATSAAPTPGRPRRTEGMAQRCHTANTITAVARAVHSRLQYSQSKFDCFGLRTCVASVSSGIVNIVFSVPFACAVRSLLNVPTSFQPIPTVCRAAIVPAQIHDDDAATTTTMEDIQNGAVVAQPPGSDTRGMIGNQAAPPPPPAAAAMIVHEAPAHPAPPYGVHMNNNNNNPVFKEQQHQQQQLKVW